MRMVALLALAVGLAPRPALAQDQVVLASVDDPTVPAERRARVERAAAESLGSIVTLEDWVRRTDREDAVPRSRVQGLATVEAHLTEARVRAADLDDRGALLALNEAEAAVRAHLDVPGAAAWYAEVQIALALVASQAGRERLARAALERAAVLDPRRPLQAAEARPALVEAGRVAIERARSGPRGRFEVRAPASGARVWVDDQPLGEAPVVVERPVGRHVLRVWAPGHRVWARAVDVLEGARPPLEVTLAPSTRLRAARDARAAATAGNLEVLREALVEVGPGAPPVCVLRVGAGPRDRALMVRCRAEGCDRERRLTPRDAALAVEPSPGFSVDAEWLLAAAPPPPPPPSWTERPATWLGVGGAVVVGALVTGLVLGIRSGDAQQIVTVNPGDL